MKTTLKFGKRNWPRENARNTKKDGLISNGEGRSDFSPAKLCLRSALCALCVLLWQSALAEMHYVDVNSTNATPPYTNWATAATNIQDAVDAAVAGDEIVVTNGTYRSVSVNKPLTLRSVNGPQSSTISGGGAVRCVYLTNEASLSGFTLTNGFSVDFGGGGVACFSGNAVVSKCVIIGNHVFVDLFEDGISWLLRGGGAYGVTLNNCTLTSNSVDIFDGFGVIANTITAGGGGAAYCALNNCTLSGNTANFFNYTPFNYYVPYVEGGAAIFCTLNNCTLSSNSVTIYETRGSAYGGGASHCTLNNCTLTGNSARSNTGQGAFGGGAAASTLNNCIVYLNTSPSSPAVYQCQLNYCWGGDPLFVNQAAGNLRLQPNSPCINAGNSSYVTSATDLEGNPRIVSGTVDIGAYEYQSLDLLNCGVVSNQFGFNITGQSNWVIVLETSGDFTDWTALTTNSLDGHPFPFRDPAPPNLPQRFYRARLQQ
jgi:hypothetical protein